MPIEQCAPKRWFGSDMLMINLLYLDRCDESINLTIEIEKINEISFLDILVKRCLNNSFMTSVLWPLHQMRLDQNSQGVKWIKCIGKVEENSTLHLLWSPVVINHWCCLAYILPLQYSQKIAAVPSFRVYCPTTADPLGFPPWRHKVNSYTKR